MTISVLNDCEPERWDDFIKQFPSSSPFHTRAWTDCFKSERMTPLYLRFLCGDQPIGGIAGLVIDPRLTILRGIDRKLSFFSGPALCQMNSALIRECMLGLKRYAHDQGFTSVISSGRDYPYAYDWGDSKVHLQTIEEYIVDLSESWEHVKTRMRRSIHEQTRKAERAGLTFHEHRGATMLPQLLRLLENTQSRRERKSGYSFSPYYLPHIEEKPLNMLSETSMARFFVARRGSEVLCVLLVFAFSERAYAMLVGCSDEGYNLRAPAFVFLNAIKYLKTEGMKSLNLAGGNTFAKLSLGAEARTCTGSISPYLKDPVRNLLFQTYRWLENLTGTTPYTGPGSPIRHE